MIFYKSSVGRYFMLFALVPAFIICIIITIISTNIVYKVKVNDTRDMLRGAAKELVYSYELLAVEKTGFRKVNGVIYAGDLQVSDDYTIVDRIKGFTGADISLFYMDTRVVTTLLSEDGSRYVGTKATDVWNNYLQFGNDYFDESININGVDYFGYYIPVHSGDNIIIGMGFAGIPSSDIHATIRKLNTVAICTCIVLCCVSLLLCIIVSKRLLMVQNGILNYLNEIDNSEFRHVMPEWIYKRHDEYGIMARHFVKLNDSLQELIEKDALTGLYNRRAAMRFLAHYVVEANCVDGENFSLAIGDIDFFKKVNDTYGHNCGDFVLKKISEILSCIHENEGFTARWGGEEFILVFKGGLDLALEKLNRIADQIRETVIVYDDHEIKVTMTFGVAEYMASRNLDILISKADVLLYKGKENGRNMIVS